MIRQRRSPISRACLTTSAAATLIVSLIAPVNAAADAGDASRDSNAAAPATQDQASSARLVRNGHFQSGLQGWSTTGEVDRIATNNGRHPGYAMRLRNAGGQVALARGEKIAVAPGETLTLTASTRRLAGAGKLGIEFWDAGGNRLANSQGDPGREAKIGVQHGLVTTDLHHSRGWHSLTVSAAVPDRAVAATVLLTSSGADSGELWFDDVRVTSLLPSPIRVEDAGFENNRDMPGQTSWTMSAPALGAAGHLCTDPPTDDSSYRQGATLCLRDPGNARPHSGRRALYLSGAAPSGDANAVSKSSPTTAGSTITASVWVTGMASSAGSGKLSVVFRDRAGAVVDQVDQSVDVVAEGQWRQHRLSAIVPDSAVAAAVRLSASRGQIAWDDVDLRSDSTSGYSSAIGDGSVLFVGDDRVDSYSGMARVVHPGTSRTAAGLPDGQVLAPSAANDQNPRASWVDTAESPARFFYIAGGLTWVTSLDPSDPSGTVFTAPRQNSREGAISMVRNPSYTQGGSAPKYFGLRFAAGANAPVGGYFAYRSDDGLNWTQVGSAPVLPGLDVAYVTHDGEKFVATLKLWVRTPGQPRLYDRSARTAYIATSTDFVHWSVPRSVFAADIRDIEKVEAENPVQDPQPNRAGKFQRTADVYGAPVFRYGEQYLAIPWLFDITYAGGVDANGYDAIYKDVGRAHLQLASSTDLQRWSRPDRTPIVTPGKLGTWNWGFHQPSQDMVTVGDEVRYYYTSFEGEHSCGLADRTAGHCSVLQGPARTGLVTWKRDRFVSFRAGPEQGSLTTKVLTPSANRLWLNANVATGGSVRVEVLRPDGSVIPGYASDQSTVVTGDQLNAQVSWAGKDLPAGDIRLRIIAVDADVYSFGAAR